jgi:hypothetical protein
VFIQSLPVVNEAQDLLAQIHMQSARHAVANSRVICLLKEENADYRRIF